MGKKSSAATTKPGSEVLHVAARSGDLMAVQAICSANPLEINSRDRHSRTPIHLAAWSGHAEVVNYLCKNKADVGAAAMDDMGAIHFAAQKGHLEVIKILTSAGVSFKSCNRKGMTALHYAAQGSNLELVKYLLKKGGNRDVKNKAGKTAVDLASSEEIRKLLLEFDPSLGKVAASSKEGGDAETVVSNSEVQGNDNEDEAAAVVAKEGAKQEALKRKGEGKEEVEGNQSGSKKPRVALGHLLASDDMPDDEDQ